MYCKKHTTQKIDEPFKFQSPNISLTNISLIVYYTRAYGITWHKLHTLVRCVWTVMFTSATGFSWNSKRKVN